MPVLVVSVGPCAYLGNPRRRAGVCSIFGAGATLITLPPDGTHGPGGQQSTF